MRYQSILTPHLRRKGNLAQIMTQVLTSSIIFILLASMLSCMHKRNYVERIDTRHMHQMRSLSLSGVKQASVILETTRELRLTTDGGQTWQAIPSAAVGDAFECATMIDSNHGWAVNHQGHVFTTNSAAASWTKISEIKDFTG